MSRHCLFKSIFCLTIILLQVITLSAQKDSFPFPAFEKLTARQGLSDNEVYHLTQDKMGFLWFLTNNGLNRYDGYTFKIYDCNILDSNSITAGFFYSLKEDQNGLLWMNNESQGIYSFNPKTGLFRNYRYDPKNENSLSIAQTSQLAIDKKGYIWIGTLNGLDKLDPTNYTVTHFRHSDKYKSSISNNRVYSLTVDEDDRLWMVTGTPGIDYFNTHTGELIRHFDFGSSDNPDEDWNAHAAYGVYTGKNGNMWIGSRYQGLFGYNTHSGKLINFRHRKNDPYSVSSNGVYRVMEDHNGNLWLATDAGMIDYYEKSSDRFYHRPMSSIDIVNFLEDKSQKIWIVTMNGIYSCDTRFKKINSSQLDIVNSSSSDHSAWYFYRTKKGTMYVSYAGIWVFDTLSKKLSPFKIFQNGRNVFENNTTWQIYEDSKGYLWFATIHGLVFYNPVTKTHRWYQYDANDSTALSAGSCTGIIEDRKGRYWVTTWGGGLCAFNCATGKFRAFKVNSGSNSISSGNLTQVLEASDGKLYIGSDGGGMILLDPDEEKFNIFRHSVHDAFSISSNLPICFKESKSGIIWFVTLGGGVNAFDPHSGKFRAFTTKDGLCSNSVSSIVEDNNGNYWLGTNKGISCFTPPKDPFNPKDSFQFRNYDVGDGLPDNKMNVLAGYKDVDGKIYFGSAEGGMIYFDPNKLQDNDYEPPVYITDLKLFNTSIRPFEMDSILKTPIELTQQIILSYNQNDISLEFAALNYFHPEKNQYQYKLENYNKDWISTEAGKRYANYTNLNPGKYIFRVRASNNDGLWSPHEASLIIIITPPFWQTWWFRTLVALAVIAIIYGVYRYRFQQVLRIQNIRNRIAADLHDNIGSTLNSISVYSEVAKQKSPTVVHELEQIGEASRKIIDTMSDIVWTINPQNDNLENIILRMRSFSYNLLKAKDIEHSFHADEDLNSMKLSMEERRNFFLIFKEAVNNLVKYAEATRVSIVLTHENNLIKLSVRDNGKGFSVKQFSTGNGLLNMKSRAEEMNATLSIESEPGSGTNVELTLKT